MGIKSKISLICMVLFQVASNQALAGDPEVQQVERDLSNLVNRSKTVCELSAFQSAANSLGFIAEFIAPPIQRIYDENYAPEIAENERRLARREGLDVPQKNRAISKDILGSGPETISRAMGRTKDIVLDGKISEKVRSYVSSDGKSINRDAIGATVKNVLKSGVTRTRALAYLNRAKNPQCYQLMSDIIKLSDQLDPSVAKIYLDRLGKDYDPQAIVSSVQKPASRAPAVVYPGSTSKGESKAGSL